MRCVHRLIEEPNCRCPTRPCSFFFFYLPFSPSRAPGGDHTCADAHGARQRRVPQRRQAGVGPSGCTAQASPPASRAKGARGAALPRVTRVRERRSSERPHPSGHTQRTSGGARRAQRPGCLSPPLQQGGPHKRQSHAALACDTSTRGIVDAEPCTAAAAAVRGHAAVCHVEGCPGLHW